MVKCITSVKTKIYATKKKKQKRFVEAGFLFKILNKFYIHFKKIFILCVWREGTSLEVGGQLVALASLLPPCRSWASN